MRTSFAISRSDNLPAGARPHWMASVTPADRPFPPDGPEFLAGRRGAGPLRFAGASADVATVPLFDPSPRNGSAEVDAAHSAIPGLRLGHVDPHAEPGCAATLRRFSHDAEASMQQPASRLSGVVGFRRDPERQRPSAPSVTMIVPKQRKHLVRECALIRRWPSP